MGLDCSAVLARWHSCVVGRSRSHCATAPETDFANAGDVPALVASLTYRTRQFCYLGLPALSIPVGFSASGLPLGVQLVGRPFDESSLFTVGHAYQSETDWHARAPSQHVGG